MHISKPAEAKSNVLSIVISDDIVSTKAGIDVIENGLRVQSKNVTGEIENIMAQTMEELFSKVKDDTGTNLTLKP